MRGAGALAGACSVLCPCLTVWRLSGPGLQAPPTRFWLPSKRSRSRLRQPARPAVAAASPAAPLPRAALVWAASLGQLSTRWAPHCAMVPARWPAGLQALLAMCQLAAQTTLSALQLQGLRRPAAPPLPDLLAAAQAPRRLCPLALVTPTHQLTACSSSPACPARLLLRMLRPLRAMWRTLGLPARPPGTRMPGGLLAVSGRPGRSRSAPRRRAPPPLLLRRALRRMPLPPLLLRRALRPRQTQLTAPTTVWQQSLELTATARASGLLRRASVASRNSVQQSNQQLRALRLQRLLLMAKRRQQMRSLCRPPWPTLLPARRSRRPPQATPAPIPAAAARLRQLVWLAPAPAAATRASPRVRLTGCVA